MEDVLLQEQHHVVEHCAEPDEDESAIYTYLEQLNKFARDDRIKFYEQYSNPTTGEVLNHIYIIDGDWFGMSVSTSVKRFFPVFDAQKIISKMQRGRNFDETHKYWGKSADQIAQEWTLNGQQASNLGRDMHQQIEKFYNQYAKDGFILKEGAFNDFPDLPEYKQFRAFHSEIIERFKLRPFRTEWRLFTDKELQIAGSADIVFEQKHDDRPSTFCLMDWKRVQNLQLTNKYQHGFSPLHKMDDCNYQHYCLSLSLYKYIIDHYYGITISEMYLVVLHPIHKTYKLVYVPYLRRQIEEILHQRRCFTQSSSV